MKQILDLRPVYHRLEERIRAHVILCWLALLLIRIAETTTRRHWPTIRRELEPAPPGHLHRPSRHLPPAHRAHPPQRDLLNKLDIPAPKKIVELEPET